MLSGPPNTYSPISVLDTIRHTEGNLILDVHNNWWAMFRLKGQTYELMSASGKESLNSGLTSGFRTMDTHVKLFGVVSEFQPEDFGRKLTARPDTLGITPPNRPLWDYHAAETQNVLSGDAPYQREFFISIRLKASSGGFLEGTRQAMKRLQRTVRALIGKRLLFERSDRDMSTDAARRYYNKFGSRLIASPATPRDVQWLVRRNTFRAIGEPPVLDQWKPSTFPEPDSEEGREARVFEPSVAEHRRLLGEAIIEEYDDHIVCHHGGKVRSYQRFLAISNMPEDELSFPDAEWAFIEKPVDLLLDFQVVPPQQAEKERKRQQLQSRSQQEYMAEGGAETPLSLQKAEQVSKRAEAEHRAGKPRIDCHATFALAARTKAGLESITSDIEQHYENFTIQLGRARWTQIEAFADWTPAGNTKFRDYKQPISVSALTGGMPIASSALGDNGGFCGSFYIGRTVPAGTVVTMDPGMPQRLHKSGAITVTGVLGSGKSVFCMGEQLKWAMAGHKGLYVDPKGDTQYYDMVPEARGIVERHVIREGSDTRLPVFGVYRMDTDEGRKNTHTMMQSFLIELFGAGNRVDYREALMHGLTNHLAEQRPTVKGLHDEFWRMSRDEQRYSNRIREACKDAGSQLQLYMQHPLAELVLTDDKDAREAALARGGNTDAPLSVIDTSGLKLPSREAMAQGITDESQRISQAMMHVVAASAYQVAYAAGEDPMHPPLTTITFDEAWRFLDSSSGAQVLAELIRQGRSWNITPVIASQLNEDVQSISSLTKVRFMGAADDEEDIKIGLRMMGVDAEQYVIDMVGEFSTDVPGDFLHQDIHGQVGAMHHYPVPERWAKQLGGEEPAQAKVEVLS